MQTGPTIAVIAARVFRRRQASARRKVAGGSLHLARAEALMRPWLSIACRCGANLPELTSLLNEYREIPGRNGEPFYSESTARILLADDICPRPDWLATLATARDRAVERTGPPKTLTPFREIRLLADHIHIMVSGSKHRLPAYVSLEDAASKAPAQGPDSAAA